MVRKGSRVQVSVSAPDYLQSVTNLLKSHVMKRLYKSKTDKKWSGVCGGIAEYFELDPTLVRAGYAFITIVTGIVPGIVAYFVLAYIMPTNPGGKQNG